MVDEFNYEIIKNGTYEFDTMKYFVNGDIVRAVIIIFILKFHLLLIYYILYHRLKLNSEEQKRQMQKILELI